MNQVPKLYTSQNSEYENLLYHYPFRIFYNLNGDDRTPEKPGYSTQEKIPTYIENLLERFVEAYRIFLDQCHFMDPLHEGIYFDKGARFIDVMIANIPVQKGLVAAELVDNSDFFMPEDVDAMDGKSIRILLDKNLIPNTATPIHELFHVFQYNYCNFNNMWFMEGLARWAQNLTHQRKMIEETLPQSMDTLDVLLGRAHDAEYFWRKLFSFFDDDKRFVKRLLEHSAQQASKIDNKQWSNKDKKSFSNNAYILQALLETIDVCHYRSDNELEQFINVIRNYRKGAHFRFDTPQLQQLLTVLEKCDAKYVQRRDNILYSEYFDIKEKTLHIEKLECKNLTEYELDSLNMIRHIEGDLVVSSNGIESLNGFNYLKSIKNLYIQDMHKLKMINGFNVLEGIEALEISNNPNLEEINGFNVLFKNNHTIKRSIKVIKNKKLENVSFLKGIQEVGSSFYLHHNNLKTLEGLEALERVDASLSLSYNQLRDLSALSNLTSVYGMLGLADNRLQTLHGLENLKILKITAWNGEDRVLNIQKNKNLYDISALKNITTKSRYVIILMDDESQYSKKPEADSIFYENTLEIHTTGEKDFTSIHRHKIVEDNDKLRILFGNKWQKTTQKSTWMEAHHIDFRDIYKTINYALSHNIHIFFANNYNTQKAINRHDTLLKKFGFRFITNSSETLQNLVDKQRFYEKMLAHGFGQYVPQYYQNIDDVKYPCMVKIKSGGAGRGTFIAYDRDDLKKLEDNMIMSEYLPSQTEYATSIFLKDGKIIKHFTFSKTSKNEVYILQNEKDEDIKITPCDTPFLDLFEKIVQVLSNEETYCQCSINFKIEEGIPKIFEINPRIGYTLAGFPEQFKEMMYSYIKELA